MSMVYLKNFSEGLELIMAQKNILINMKRLINESLNMILYAA